MSMINMEKKLNLMLVKYTKASIFLLVLFVGIGIGSYYFIPSFSLNFIFGLIFLYFLSIVSFIFADILFLGW